MLWVLNRLCAKFEEKRETLQLALVDLVKKISPLPAQYYGPVSWILGVGLARTDMAVWGLRQGQLPGEVSGYLSMTSQRGKSTCLRLSINFLRVALSLTSVYSKLIYLPSPFRELEPCVYGSKEQITRKLKLNYPRATKEIQPWSQHEEEGFTVQKYVMKAYDAAKNSEYLVKGVVTMARNDKYRVELEPLGYEQVVVDEQDLRDAVGDVLKGLQILHEAGLVHRDIRWKNILKTDQGKWMLIDFETVWESDQVPELKCEKLRAWDERTLVNGRYSEVSDLYLVGKLMRSIPVLSPAAALLQSKLLSHHFASAEEAFRDDYLR